jgi:diguanylate cyclase
MLEEIDANARVMRSVLDLPGGGALTAGEILSRANEALSQLSFQSELDNARLEREHVQLSAEAATDGLTGIANRRAFDRSLEQQLRLARDYGYRVSVALIDLDQFKRINDTYGHGAGDEVLRAVARVITNSIRSTDFAARYGGEEFGVIMPNTPLGGAASLANRVRAALEANVVEFDGRDIFVTMSVGVATFDPRSGVSIAELLAAADAALYEAKHAGRNAVRLGHIRSPLAA